MKLFTLWLSTACCTAAIVAGMKGNITTAAVVGSLSVVFLFYAIQYAITDALRKHVAYTINNVTVEYAKDDEDTDDEVLRELERRALFSGKIAGINPEMQ